jgi:DNA-binding XRE family transcriptional regulator
MEDNRAVMMSSPEDDDKSIRRFNEIIERIEQVRGYLGLNRSKFCRSIGMSPQTYNNFIGPQGTKPNIQLLHGVVTRFGVNPMWLFTGGGNMFLAGYGDKPSLRSIAARGVAEEGPYAAKPLPMADQEELASLLPILRRVEAALQSVDGRYTPLLNRFNDVFKRYLQLYPDVAVKELLAFLEVLERRLADDAGRGSSGDSTSP